LLTERNESILASVTEEDCEELSMSMGGALKRCK
jgi:hypothetical protein